MVLIPQVLLDGLKLPEGPRWHAGRLWVADMIGHRVLRLDPRGTIEAQWEVDDRPSGLGFLPDGTPLVTLMRSRRVMRIGAGGLELYADLRGLPGERIGELVVDGRGRAYVGDRVGWMDLRSLDEVQASTARSPEVVRLIRPDGTIEVAADDLWGPNGEAISGDGRTFVVAETRANRVSAFTVREDGTLTNRRVFAELGALPDGLCLDAEGAAWVCLPFKGEVVRVREGGEVLDRITLPTGKWAIACVLGGPDRRTLYIVTAYETIENFQKLSDFQADLGSTSRGFVEAVRVEVSGAGYP